MSKQHKKGRRKRVTSHVDDMNLTPMIDVVFQLLIYFIFTFEPLDVFTHLEVSKPSGESSTKKEDVTLLQIEVLPGGQYMVHQKFMDKSGLTRALETLAGLSKTQTVMLVTHMSSRHEDLVYVLNHCARVGLSNLHVVSKG